MTRQIAFSLALGLAATVALGCGTVVRHPTARGFLEVPGGGGAAPAGSAAPSGGGLKSQYYLTYWEGSCQGWLGCSRGDSHVKRCKVNPDNTVSCVEEPSATKALNPE